jgi:6-phosphogluconolactonase
MSFLLQCAAAAALLALSTAARADDLNVLVGSGLSGPTRGFRLTHLNTDTGTLSPPTLAVPSDHCSFFAITPDAKHLYTTNEVSTFGGVPHMGAIAAYSLDPKTAQLTLLNQQPSGGESPAYISLDKTGHFVLVANYAGNAVPGEGGTIAVFAIKPDGSLGDRTGFDQHKGTGPNPSRQRQAYAHSIITDPSNKFALSADLGLDKIFVYKFDQTTGKIAPNDPPFAAVKAGSGPRHMSFHPTGKALYVAQEMGSMITAFNWDSDKGILTPIQEISMLPADFKGNSTAAEIRVFPNGKWLYASNRGHDSIAQFAIDPVTFQLTFVGTTPSGGQTPRNFEFSPDLKWMLVANHGNNTLAAFKIDPATGKLTQSGTPLAIESPFCTRFIPTPTP